MPNIVSCGGDCFHCRWSDCYINPSDGAKTPFELEQIKIQKEKKESEKEERKRQREIDAAYVKWLRKNNIR